MLRMKGEAAFVGSFVEIVKGLLLKHHVDQELGFEFNGPESLLNFVDLTVF